MGVCIYLSISKAVTPQEWTEVYEEALCLAKELNLATRKEVKIHGIDTVYLVPVDECEQTYGWNNEHVRHLWSVDGDYLYMRTAESFSMPRALVKPENVDQDAGDAMITNLTECLDYTWDDPEFGNAYCLWGGKTQGEPYHMYLLAIACFIEAKLGTKAFVFGDITRGQCKRAVEIANQFLKKPIDMPDRCYMDRFLKRVSVLPFAEEEKLEIFRSFYLGTKGAEFGAFIRKVYSEETIDAVWEKEFSYAKIGTIGFSKSFSAYMLQGFDLQKLCEFVQFKDKEEETEEQYEAFVKRVMDAKLHIPKKNCEDILANDQEAEMPYGIDFFMSQFLYSSARNEKIDRYIPLEEIRMALLMGIGEKCDVNRMIDTYLEKEAEELDLSSFDQLSTDELEQAVQQDASEVFTQFMKIKAKMQAEGEEYYDINRSEDLQFYEKGDRINPSLGKVVGKSRRFLDGTLKEDTYKKLMEEEPQTRKEWMIEQNRSILIRDKDWVKIFSDIETDGSSFARYYPLTRVKITDNTWELVKALLINDDLYTYSKELAEQYADEETGAV